MANKINVDAIIQAHPHQTIRTLEKMYAQTANECENKHWLGVALPKDGHGDTWLQRAETAKQIVQALRAKVGD